MSGASTRRAACSTQLPPTSRNPTASRSRPTSALLYVVDTGATHRKDGPRHVRRFRVNEDGRSVSGGEVFAQCTEDVFDGLRIDTRGNLWIGAGDGVHCYAPDGVLIGKVRVPEVVANVCFGGAKRNRLFICATTSLYAIYVNVAGATRVASEAAGQAQR